MNDNTFILFCNFESFVYFILKKKNENFFNKLIQKDENLHLRSSFFHLLKELKDQIL